MRPFSAIRKEYFLESEKEVFDKLNALTYRHFGKALDGNFVNVEPPTFVLWYTNDIQRSMKPFSTKLIVSIHRNGKGVQVKASVYSNKGFLLTLILILVSLPIQLYRSFDLKTLLIHMLFLLAIATWDYWAKVSAIKELETIIL